jgi:hypothetical protein
MSEAVSPPPPAATIAAWRILLRGLGAFVALFVFCFWAAKGYNTGWTKHQVQVRQIDPITELEFLTYEKRFVPGVEYLVGGVAAGVVLFGVTLPGRRKPVASRA